MTTIQLTSVPKGQEFNPTLRRQTAANCSLLNGLGVHFAFRSHLVDTETGKHGMRGLIERIFTEKGSILPRHEGELEGEQRQAYIAKSLTVEQVNDAVRGVLPPNDRYILQSIRQYLSSRLFHDGTIGKFPMTKAEQGVNSSFGKRPNWYYLIQAPAEDKASE